MDADPAVLLGHRQEELLHRLRGLELVARQIDIEQRIQKLELLLHQVEGGERPAEHCPERERDVAPTTQPPARICTAEGLLAGIGGVSDVVQRVGDECERLGTHSARLVRVRSDYYDLTLDQRRGLLQAPSTAHLCKSLVMENTKATVEDLQIPGMGSFYDGQYRGVFAQLLRLPLHALSNRRLPQVLLGGCAVREAVEHREAPHSSSSAMGREDPQKTIQHAPCVLRDKF